jgi:hypothetical protein
MVKAYLQRSSRSSWGGRVELPGPPAPLPPRFTPAICTCIIWKKAKGSSRLRIFTSCLAPPRTPRPKEPVLRSYSASKTQTRWKILRVRSIHSPPRFREYAYPLWKILPGTLVDSPGFCEYANSLWKILPVNARLLSKILRIRVFTLAYSASYARLLSKILWLRSFTLEDSASTLNSDSKILRVRSFALQDSASTLYVCIFRLQYLYWQDAKYHPPPPKSSTVRRPFWSWQCRAENRVVLPQGFTFWLWKLLKYKRKHTFSVPKWLVPCSTAGRFRLLPCTK